MTTLDLSWVGKRVKTSPASSIYLVRAISSNGQRAFLSLAIDPKFICSEPASDLILYEPEKVQCPICHQYTEVEPDRLHVNCSRCNFKISVWDIGGAREGTNEN